jgi:hypothetical protein
MKKWYLIDNCINSKGLISVDELPAATQEEALKIATLKWNRLSEHDQKCRDAYYIGYMENEDEDIIQFDTMTDIVFIKPFTH